MTSCCVCPVSAFVILTPAPGTTPPASSTTPLMLPCVSCALAGSAAKAAANSPIHSRIRIELLLVGSCSLDVEFPEGTVDDFVERFRLPLAIPQRRVVHAPAIGARNVTPRNVARVMVAATFQKNGERVADARLRPPSARA